jgi:hypothetical protein
VGIMSVADAWPDAWQAPGQHEAGAFVGLMYQMRLRSLEDRQHVARLFKQHFGTALPCAADAGWSVTPGWLHAGPVSLPRRALREAGPGGLGEVPAMLPGMVEPMQAVMACVRLRWMCLVTGPAASGKTSLIRYWGEGEGEEGGGAGCPVLIDRALLASLLRGLSSPSPIPHLPSPIPSIPLLPTLLPTSIRIL